MSAGVWVIILSCLFASSIEPILVKLGFLNGVAPLLLIVCRTAFAGALVAMLNIKNLPRLVTWEQYKKIFPLAFLLLTTNSLMIFALIYSNPSLVVTIIKLTPIGVGIGTYFTGKERVDAYFWLGLFCSLLGISLTIDVQLSVDSVANVKGIALSFLAVLSSTVYRILLGRHTQTIKPGTISSCIFISNGIIALGFLPFLYRDMNLQLLTMSAWTGSAAICANVAFIYAVKHVGAARMSVIDLLQRPLVIILSMFILGELVSVKPILGLILVVLGVYLANVYRRRGHILNMEKVS